MDYGGPGAAAGGGGDRGAYSRGLYYDLMVYLYDHYEVHQPEARTALFKGLAEENELLRRKMHAFWGDPNRLSADASMRVLQLMRELYSPAQEKDWLGEAVPLFLQVTSKRLRSVMIYS